jgi:transcriptional regulator with XRE-family HTH domain
MEAVLSKRIREKISLQLLPVSVLEREAGLKTNAIRNILLGNSKNPSAETVKAIASILNCSIDELLDTTIKPSENNRKHELLEIEYLTLYKDSVAEAVSLFEKHNKFAKYKDICFLSIEIYLFASKDKEKKVDKKFSEWLFSRHFE